MYIQEFNKNMKELLDKVLSEVLTEESRAELSETIQTAITEAVDAQVAEKQDALVVEYAAQFAADREALIEAIDTKVEEMLQEQLTDLADDISNFRDLEVEFATRLVQEKAALAEAVEADMKQLVERLDTFLELRLSEEVDQLKESIEEVRKINTGMRIFEAFKDEVQQFVNADNGLDVMATELAEAKAELARRDEALNEAKQQLQMADRKEKLEDTLSSLQGRPREIMEAVLKSIPTEKLQETYDKFIDRVLHESVTKSSEKESATPVEAPVLAEGKELENHETLNENLTVVTGDNEDADEIDKPVVLSEAARHMQRLAGIGY